MANGADQTPRIREWFLAHPKAQSKDAAVTLNLHRTTVNLVRAAMVKEGLLAAPNHTGGRPSIAPDAAATQRNIALQDEINAARKQLRDVVRQQLNDEAIERILGLIARKPVHPPKWLVSARRVKGRNDEVPVLMWSDWHAGEVVERDEALGYNEYNLEIFERRVRELVDATIHLIELNQEKVPGIVVNLLGDFVSGALHPELEKTDEEEILPSTFRVFEILVWALRTLADRFGNLYVPCTGGNHGRLTKKTEFKRNIYKNVDWLIYKLLQREFQNDPRVVIDIRPSNEVYYRVYGVRFLAMHGDLLGVKGGDGIIGAIGPIMRGEIKTRGQHTSLASDYDVLLMGHWHQPLWLPRAFVNNSLKGFDEFAKNALRATPTIPSQLMFFVHPRRGITLRREILVDQPETTQNEWISWSK